MHNAPSHSGEMSQDSAKQSEHPKAVTPDLAPGSTRGKAMFRGLSASSAGLEFGISVILGLLFGRWLDGKAGTEPWLMILFLCFGFVAGIRGVMRAMKRIDRESASPSGDAARSGHAGPRGRES